MKKNDCCCLIICLFFSLIWLPVKLNAQNIAGCTDIHALNFNPNANSNDGSCIYPPTNYVPTFLGNFGSQLDENSGLIFWGNSLWTINDSGNDPILFQVDSSNAQIIASIWVENVSNVDWEAITQSDLFIYIGDFGNSSGDRTDLKIIRLSKTEILNRTKDTISASIIQYSYNDQTDFTSSPLQTTYDAEALYWFNDSLYIFTKDWLNGFTKRYVLDDFSGSQIAQLKDSFHVEGMVTDACISEDGQKIILLGYKDDLTVFIWMLWDFPGNEIFNGNKRKLGLDNVLMRGQTEGICLLDSHRGFISSERFNYPQYNVNTDPQLYSFDFSQFWTSPDTTSILEPLDVKTTLSYPNPAHNEFSFYAASDQVLVVYGINGKVLLEISVAKGVNVVDCSQWLEGIYYLKFSNQQKKQKLVKLK